MPAANNQRRPNILRRNPKRSLASVVGAGAAAALLVLIPKEESGRTVEAKIEGGTVVTTNVRGDQHRTAYRDIVGVVTICDGDTANIRMGMTVSEQECRERLEQQIINHAEPVMACVPALREPHHQNQLIASVSLAYNIGTGNARTRRGGFCGSSVARRFNAGDWRGGCDAFLVWNKAGGRAIRGLTLRRQRERITCLRGL